MTEEIQDGGVFTDEEDRPIFEDRGYLYFQMSLPLPARRRIYEEAVLELAFFGKPIEAADLKGTLLKLDRERRQVWQEAWWLATKRDLLRKKRKMWPELVPMEEYSRRITREAEKEGLVE